MISFVGTNKLTNWFSNGQKMPIITTDYLTKFVCPSSVLKGKVTCDFNYQMVSAWNGTDKMSLVDLLIKCN